MRAGRSLGGPLFGLGVVPRYGADAIRVLVPRHDWRLAFLDDEPAIPRIVRMDPGDLDDSGGAFRVVPRSHLSFHSDANPYLRYLSHPAEIHVRPSAGDILLFAGSVFHGGGESSSATGQDNGHREVIEMTYRPLWARPAGPVEEWEPDHLEKIPAQARRFLISRNAGIERSASRTGS